MGAVTTGDEIVRFPDRHDDAEVQVDSGLLAVRAGDGLQEIGKIRLRPDVELHIRVNRERVAAFLAHPFACAVRLQGSAIHHELVGLADGAAHTA